MFTRTTLILVERVSLVVNDGDTQSWTPKVTLRWASSWPTVRAFVRTILALPLPTFKVTVVEAAAVAVGAVTDPMNTRVKVSREIAMSFFIVSSRGVRGLLGGRKRPQIAVWYGRCC